MWLYNGCLYLLLYIVTTNDIKKIESVTVGSMVTGLSVTVSKFKNKFEETNKINKENV